MLTFTKQLLPKCTEAANQLAKVSNDIADIYIDVYAAGMASSLSRDEIMSSEYSGVGGTPTYPPGLFKSVEEAKATANANISSNYLEKQVMLLEPSASAVDFLEKMDGESFVDTMLRITGPWGMARFGDILRLKPSAGHDLWKTFDRILNQMAKWDREILLSSVWDYELTRKSQDPDSQRSSPPTTQRKTWAKVAAIPEAIGGAHAHTISLMKSPGLYTPQTIESGALKPNYEEPIELQQRVVFVRGCKKGTKLRSITKRIKEGPLMSVMLERDPGQSALLSACIIFQMAEHALEFVRMNRLLLQTIGQTRYGPGVTVVQGGPWPEDAEIRAMSRRERRRLTFSGSGLFARVPRNKFQADIAAIAGEHNVELIWLFNAGNATVVLASVSDIVGGNWSTNNADVGGR